MLQFRVLHKKFYQQVLSSDLSCALHNKSKRNCSVFEKISERRTYKWAMVVHVQNTHTTGTAMMSSW